MTRCSTELDAALRELESAKQLLAALTPSQQGELITQCMPAVVESADAWVQAGVRAKSPPAEPSIVAEEIVNGPTVTLRFLQLTAAALRDLEQGLRPRIPGALTTDGQGRLLVPLLPARGLFDALNFLGFRAHARMLPEVTRDSFPRFQAASYFAQPEAGITLVLGAGNVSSIAVLDALTKLVQDRQVVLLKMNPVNDYLTPVFQQALRPFVQRNFLRIVRGGSDVGAAAIAHPHVSRIHITGSAESHDAIVWGPPGPLREQRKRDGTPLLNKPITSELGNVTPWIIVPGRYSARQLEFQAENIAASITNNVSFNCVATKLIVTSRQWPDRVKFLNLVDRYLAATPRRRAYYPGAVDRFVRFAHDGQPPSEAAETLGCGILPWTLRRDIDPEHSPHLVREESFVCVCAETALDVSSPADFLQRAVDFVNHQVWGTLCAAITLPHEFQRSAAGRQSLDLAIDRLRYGAVAINHWPALVYALMSTPWGGYPDSDLRDIQSGCGWVHNTCMLQGVEKTVLRGPLTVYPKPVWFPLHPNPEHAARRMLQLYAKPTWPRWSALLASSLWPR